MEKSTSIKSIAAALLKFHGLVGKIAKDASNPFFSTAQKKAKYATLSNIQEAIRQPLQDAGLTYVQFPDGNNGLTTILMHSESGEYIQATYVMHPAPSYDKEKDGNKVIWRSEPYVSPQGLGSAITYARRYALGAILGLNIDDDDDGNAASQTGKQQASKAATTNDIDFLAWEDSVTACNTLEELTRLYNSNKPVTETNAAVKKMFSVRRKNLETT